MYRVMIADDEYLIHLSLRKLIESSGTGFHVVGEAEDGKEALSLLDRCSPDLVITDICMPEMDGLEFIEAAKRTHPNTRFIILSGHSDFEYAQKAIRFGVSDFLLKPVDPDQLKRTLLQIHEKLLINKQRYSRQNEWLGKLNELQHQLIDQMWAANEDLALQTLNAILEHYHSRQSDEITVPQLAENVLSSIEKHMEKRDFRFSKTVSQIEWQTERQSVIEQTRSKVIEMIAEIKGSRNLGSRLNMLKAVKYMENHYASEQLTLQQVADSIGISVAYFSRSFKEEMNMSFIKYLINIRMEKAKSLLETTDRSTSDIALQVGFSDYPHFSKTFKKIFGLTPSEYRKQIKHTS